jgi:hypothetical protein
MIQTGNPMATAILQSPDVAKGLAQPVQAAVEQAPAAALPTAGALLGGTVGSVGGPAGTAIGAGAGAAAGEGANQALGITEPSVDSVILNGAIPMAGQLLGSSVNAAARFMGRRLPGATSTMHELVAEDLGKIPGMFRPTATADQLYSVVDKFNAKVPMTNLQKMSGQLLSKEEQAAAGLKLPNVSKTAEGLAESAGLEGGMPFQDIRVNLRRVGDKIRETREAGGEEHGAYKSLFKAMMDDLDAAVASGDPSKPTVLALKAANMAAKREYAADEIGDLFTIKGGGISPRPRPDGSEGVQVNFGRIMKALKSNDDLKRSLTPEEYDKIIKDVSTMWGNTPNLPAVAGQDAGSKRTVQAAAVGGALGGAAAYQFGLPASVAIPMGSAIFATLPNTLGKLMVSQGGRNFLRGVLQGTGGVISPATLGVLSTAVGNTPPSRDTGVKLTEFGRQYMMGEGQ